MRLPSLVLAALVATGCRSPRAEAPPAAVSGAAPAVSAESERRAPRPTLSVAEAVAEALEANRSVLSARQSIRVADETVIEARAGLLPTLNARGSFSVRDTPALVTDPALGVPVTVGPKDLFALDVTASFPLFAFGEYYYAWRAAQLARGVTEAEAAATESDIADAVTAACFDYLEAKNQIDVAAANVAALEKQVADARAIESAGRMTRDAVLEAEVELARATRTKEKIESLVPIRRIVLNSLLNRPTDFPTDILDDPRRTAPPAEEEPRVLEEAVLLRPEIRAANLDVERAEKDAKSALGAALPEFRGSALYHSDDNTFSEPDNYGALGVTVDVPLFAGGANAARVRRARHEVELSRIARDDVIATVRTEVSQALRDVNETWKDIAVTEQSIVKAEESLRIQSEKFKAGRATSREVLDSNSLLTTTRFEHVRSVYNYNVALQRLHRARGGDPRRSPLAAP
jgi:outer membrane protein TolC